MAQTMYAHMNKWISKPKKISNIKKPSWDYLKHWRG
jgi:hypothetical protein